MKKYTTDMVKLIVLLIVTPLLVMAYTTIEKTVSAKQGNQAAAGFKSVTPIAIGLMDKIDVPATVRIKKPAHFLAKNNRPVSDGLNLKERSLTKNNITNNRFVAILL